MLTLKTVILGIKIDENLEVGLGCSGQEPRLALLEETPIHGKGEEWSGAGKVEKVHGKSARKRQQNVDSF